MASTPTAEPYVRPRQRTVWFAVRAGCARLRAVLAAQAHKAWGHGIVELSCAGRAGCFVAACRPRATADRTRCTPVWPFLALNALSALANCIWHGTFGADAAGHTVRQSRMSKDETRTVTRDVPNTVYMQTHAVRLTHSHTEFHIVHMCDVMRGCTLENVCCPPLSTLSEFARERAR